MTDIRGVPINKQHTLGNGFDADPPPPHSIESEQWVLGGLLIAPAKWEEVVGVIRGADDFYRNDHRVIFTALEQLASAGKPFDVVLVLEQLRGNEQEEAAGGLAYLGQLARDTATAENIGLHAEKVAERAKLRRLQALGSTIESAIAEGFSSTQIAHSLQTVLEAMPRPRSEPPAKREPLDWHVLQDQEPPERAWAIDRWLGMGHVTLLAGGAGTGKTLIGQTLGSCLALQQGDFLDWMPSRRRVLMWACEDDAPELWRRQVSIAKWLGASLSDFAGRFTLHSYNGQMVELATLVDQRRLIATSMLAELREQIGDYRAEVVILDNVARLYAGNENDRYQVTTFIAMLTAAAAATQAAVLLLGHPGKAQGSEWSGSTAWEAAVRARLYLGRKLPDAEKSDDEDPSDDGVRYLCRRKANYSDRDWRRLTLRDGVLVPDAPPAAPSGLRAGTEFAREVVIRAVRKLAEMGEHGAASSGSQKYLPRLAREYKLLDALSEKDFASTMRAMRKDGALITVVVGKYANRTPREGLAVAGDGLVPPRTSELHK